MVSLKTRNENVSTFAVIYIFDRPHYIVLMKGGVYHTQKKKLFPSSQTNISVESTKGCWGKGPEGLTYYPPLTIKTNNYSFTKKFPSTYYVVWA